MEKQQDDFALLGPAGLIAVSSSKEKLRAAVAEHFAERRRRAFGGEDDSVFFRREDTDDGVLFHDPQLRGRGAHYVIRNVPRI